MMVSQKLQDLVFNEKYYSIVPRPTLDEWHALDHSIAAHGLQEPITINEKGVILDGYTRYEICQNRGISITTRTKSFETPESELRYVLEVNATRRQLNAFQRVELFIDIFRVYQKEGRENNNWHIPKKNPVGGALVRYSEVVGIGQKRVHAAIKIIESDNEELKQQCRDGTITVNAAYNSMSDNLRKEVTRKSTYPTVKSLLDFFKDRPIKDQLESILQIYRESKK